MIKAFKVEAVCHGTKIIAINVVAVEEYTFVRSSNVLTKALVGSTCATAEGRIKSAAQALSLNHFTGGGVSEVKDLLAWIQEGAVGERCSRRIYLTETKRRREVVTLALEFLREHNQTTTISATNYTVHRTLIGTGVY